MVRFCTGTVTVSWACSPCHEPSVIMGCDHTSFQSLRCVLLPAGVACSCSLPDSPMLGLVLLHVQITPVLVADAGLTGRCMPLHVTRLRC